jgi:UDP-3-O-[3-hydroxymyristoyl] N-acetylglucosamine deacetylase
VTIPAHTENVVDTLRCTRLEGVPEVEQLMSDAGLPLAPAATKPVSVSTVEHLMSAFAGLGIPIACVELDGPELPILDGSSAAWVKALNSVMPERERKLYTTPVSEPIRVEGPGGSFISATPADKLSITLTIAYEHPVIGTQTAYFNEGDDYEKEIAPARTFGLRSEVDALLAAGLAKGGSLDNAIIVEDDGYSTPLRFENELARHKLLDLLGDLYLSGSLPRADIIAVKPSHTLNVALASKLNRGL